MLRNDDEMKSIKLNCYNYNCYHISLTYIVSMYAFDCLCTSTTEEHAHDYNVCLFTQNMTVTSEDFKFGTF